MKKTTFQLGPAKDYGWIMLVPLHVSQWEGGGWPSPLLGPGSRLRAACPLQGYPQPLTLRPAFLVVARGIRVKLCDKFKDKGKIV